MSKVTSVGNVWVTAATIAKIAMPAGAKKGDAFLFGIDAAGDMAIVGPIDPDGTEKLPPGMKYVCGATIETTVERLATRLREAATQ